MNYKTLIKSDRFTVDIVHCDDGNYAIVVGQNDLHRAVTNSFIFRPEQMKQMFEFYKKEEHE